MKGVIFNVVKSFVVEKFGEEAYKELIAETELESKGVFVGPGTYSDQDFFNLAVKATEKFSVPMIDLQRLLGHYAFPKLAAMCPHFVEKFSHPRDFLKTIEDVVHVEVKKLYLNANTPTFKYEEPADDKLVMEYFSERKLCHFLGGLIEGVGDFYSHKITQNHATCIHDGAASCRFELSF